MSWIWIRFDAARLRDGRVAGGGKQTEAEARLAQAGLGAWRGVPDAMRCDAMRSRPGKGGVGRSVWAPPAVDSCGSLRSPLRWTDK
jgi:hypothetical protein